MSLALSAIFFRDFWASLLAIFSPASIINQNQAAPWGALLLCVIFLFLKRKDWYREMGKWDRTKAGSTWFWMLGLIGLALIVAAVLIPADPAFLLFKVLLAALGIFVFLFGPGARLPAIMIALYGFVIAFPLFVERFADEPYSRTVIFPLMHLLPPFGFPLHNDGQWLNLVSAGGQPISVEVISGCAGPSTMALFVALFTLMMLDTPLSPRKAIGMFFLGVAGTWFQSFLRIVILMLAGYFLGENALWEAHSWTIYILFPLWYLLYAYIYFQQVRRPSIIRTNVQEPENRGRDPDL